MYVGAPHNTMQSLVWYRLQHFFTRLYYQAKKTFVVDLMRRIFGKFNDAGIQYWGLFFIIMILQGCGAHIYHFVEPGETLYSISWAYGHDYHDVARWNHIAPPYIVRRGQRIRVAAPAPVATHRGVEVNQTNKTLTSSPSARVVNKGSISHADNQGVTRYPADSQNGSYLEPKILTWQWPVKGGKVVRSFDRNDPGKQGLDVAGHEGQAIFCAEAGQVVYSGGGLNRYGKLIIIKHNETYLSAYAHNKSLLVKEGDVLKSGQKIAEMGNTGSSAVELHFEIRRNGKPVNPLLYLPKR